MKVRLLIGCLNLIAITAYGPCGPKGCGQVPPGRPAGGWNCKNTQYNCPINASCIDKKPSGFTCECNQGKRSKIII